ncbi:MAG: hypothetical protein IPK19_04535 [Chloroflexi bacterium]|nr:hypothetical protein [Chloroflexota bacterium]
MRLPSNAELIAYSQDVAWDDIERKHRQFNRALESMRAENTQSDRLPVDRFSEAVGNPVEALYGADDPNLGNVLTTTVNGRPIMLAGAVSNRYRAGYDFLHSLVPYNLNPSVNHTNIAATEDSNTRLRVLGAEIELGLVHPDGRSPSEAEVKGFMQAYYNHALRIGVPVSGSRSLLISGGGTRRAQRWLSQNADGPERHDVGPDGVQPRHRAAHAGLLILPD